MLGTMKLVAGAGLMVAGYFAGKFTGRLLARLEGHRRANEIREWNAKIDRANEAAARSKAMWMVQGGKSQGSLGTLSQINAQPPREHPLSAAMAASICAVPDLSESECGGSRTWAPSGENGE